MRPDGSGRCVVGASLIDQPLGPRMNSTDELRRAEAEVLTRLALRRRRFDSSQRCLAGSGVLEVFAKHWRPRGAMLIRARRVC